MAGLNYPEGKLRASKKIDDILKLGLSTNTQIDLKKLILDITNEYPVGQLMVIKRVKLLLDVYPEMRQKQIIDLDVLGEFK